MNKHYVYSAPDCTEIGGNHTDHQHGCVLAAAVNLETIAEVEYAGWRYQFTIKGGFPYAC